MRRQYGEIDYIDYLRSLDCVLYCPLTQDNTNNLMNNAPMVPLNSTSTKWNTTETAWEFNQLGNYGANSYNAKWQFDYQIINSHEMTFLIELKPISSFYATIFNPYPNYISYDIYPTRMGLSASCILNSWSKSATIYNTYQTKYVNGNLGYNGTTSATFNSTDFTLTAANVNGNINTACYARNLYAFNRTLTLEQIKQIQGIS